MPLYNMTADGDLYESSADESDGSGFERKVETVDDVDASGWAEMGYGTGIDNPYITAQQIRNTERMEEDAAQAHQDNLEEVAHARAERNRKAHAYGRAMNEARNEEIRLSHMGQDPLLAMAVAQQMSGADYEQQSISGYGHSSDGSFEHDRTMGRMGRHRHMGDFWSDINAQLDSAKDSALSIVGGGAETLLQNAVDNITGQNAEAAPTPAAQARAIGPVYPKHVAAPMTAQTKQMILMGVVGIAALLVVPKLLKR